MATGPRKPLQQTMDELFGQAEKTISIICNHVASGGSVIDLCETWEVPYAEVRNWIRLDKDRKERFAQAMEDRSEYERESIIMELSNIKSAKQTDFFDEENKIKHPSEWTPAMKSIVKEIILNDDREVVKVVFWNKEKALELLGKKNQLYTENHKVEGHMTLEQLVAASRGDDGK